MNKLKIKLIISGGMIFVVSGLLGFMVKNNFDEIQTSLVKYYRGASYQCVAYVERYYQTMFGIKIKNVGRAMNLAKKAKNYGLYFHKNNGLVSPQPGDILVFGNRNRIGHVAIITGVLKDGVLIVEQNWHRAQITNNKGKALKANYQNSKYNILDRSYSSDGRNKFWVMGWVGRQQHNPNTFFDFKKNDFEGWMLENGARLMKNQHKSFWAIKIVGHNPRIVSPVFLDGLPVKIYKSITFKFKIEGNNKATGGVVYLRDINDKWSEQVPFTINNTSQDFQAISVDLSKLNPDFKITQIMLKLTNNNNRWKEVWKLDWLRIGEQKANILTSK
jgi:surface antigen